VSNVGDFGRRVAERRQELGLSRDQVAARAGMHVSFLQLIEEHPSRQLTRASLVRLAAALETTVDALSGAGMLAPPGGSKEQRRGVLTRLDAETCEALMAPGGIGRVVMTTDRGPVALPVNYKMLDHDVVFRTMSSAEAVSAVGRGEISFEVDRFDEVLEEGWSVLVTGEGRAVTDPAELDAVEALGVSPWAAGSRERFLRISPHQVTGRRIRRR
jgi:transcriptional regulator with XRE-family HTH domain